MKSINETINILSKINPELFSPVEVANLLETDVNTAIKICRAGEAEGKFSRTGDPAFFFYKMNSN